MTQYLTFREVTERLRVSRMSVWRWVRPVDSPGDWGPARS